MPHTLLASIEQLPPIFWLAPLGAAAALLTAVLFGRSVRARSEGEPEMIRIAAAVREGAMAYLSRQYRVVAIVFVGLVGFLALAWSLNLQPALSMLGVPVAGFLSALCGWFGMRMATAASARTAFAAKSSLNDGLTVAFRSGAVMGLNVVGFALLDASVWFLVLNSPVAQTLGLTGDLREMTAVMLSFAMGASTQALFARVGGGIYTKAADVGADLVGKVEAGIPEDDPRNPATIADNVGDNVGDVAGMGADLYESYYGSILATMALGAAAAYTLPISGGERAQLAMLLVIAPLVLAGVGVIFSISGIFAVRAREDATFAQLLRTLQFGVTFASVLIAAGAIAIFWVMLGNNTFVRTGEVFSWWGPAISVIAGLFGGVIIARATEYYTSYENAPTRGIARQALTGPATVIIGGIATGMRSTWIPMLTVAIAVIAAFVASGGNHNFLMGLYGVSIAAVGMLATLGITLATDAYGPIADNAGGNAEMSGQPAFVRERTDKLDSLGNTTAATGKGFAIGSAALTALALFAAYVQVVQTQLVQQAGDSVRAFAQSPELQQAVASEPGNDIARYAGKGQFVYLRPGAEGEPVWTDCLLITDPEQLAGTHFEETVQPGALAPVRVLTSGEGDDDHRSARRFAVTINVPHGDHSHEYELEVTSARNGSIQDVLTYYRVTLTEPRVLAGMFIGVLLAFLFCAMTMSAVGRAAYAMMGECRQQFALMRQALRAGGMTEQQIADPEQWPRQIEHDGISYPDYARCVAISTAGAQREMIAPACLAILVPILVGLLLSVPGVMGMLAGGAVGGFALAVFMANAGGAWDNAKKLLESYGRITADAFISDPQVRERFDPELRDALMARAVEMQKTGKGSGFVYGKGSDDHKATVVGDTVGDPFKDTSGPSLNILIKLISIVSVVFAGVIVKYGPFVGSFIGLR